MDSDSPEVDYYINATTKHDCFFIVGPESGPTERIGSFKIILMAHSEPFQKMFGDSDISEKGDVNLPDIEPKTFKDFLKCLYGACDNVLKHLSFDECVKMLYIAEKYLVVKMKKKVISRLLQFSHLTLDNLFTGLASPVYFIDDKLKKEFAETIFKNTKEVFDDERFLSLDDKALMIIVKQDAVSVPEIIVWKAILKWGIHNANSKNGNLVRGKISSLLQFIRFRSMGLKEFYDSVIPANVFTSDEAIELSTSLMYNTCHNTPGISQNRRSRYVPQEVEQEQLTYLHYYVKNITELIDGKDYYSEPLELGEYRWKIKIKKNSTDFNFFIVCHQSLKVKQNYSWECCVGLDYILVNQNHKLNIHEYGCPTITNGFLWGYDSFIKWNDLIDPAKGFIEDNNILLSVRVKINPTK